MRKFVKKIPAKAKTCVECIYLYGSAFCGFYGFPILRSTAKNCEG